VPRSAGAGKAAREKASPRRAGPNHAVTDNADVSFNVRKRRFTMQKTIKNQDQQIDSLADLRKETLKVTKIKTGAKGGLICQITTVTCGTNTMSKVRPNC
jgi:hypothetical protein